MPSFLLWSSASVLCGADKLTFLDSRPRLQAAILESRPIPYSLIPLIPLITLPPLIPPWSTSLCAFFFRIFPLCLLFSYGALPPSCLVSILMNRLIFPYPPLSPLGALPSVPSFFLWSSASVLCAVQINIACSTDVMDLGWLRQNKVIRRIRGGYQQDKR